MKFYIYNFGCQMNEHDVSKMTSLLLSKGFSTTTDVKNADIIIVNTCCVREKAEQKFYSLMGRLKTMKKRRGTILGVTGCIAQQEMDGIREKLPFLDFSLGPGSIHRVTEAVKQANNRNILFDFSDNGCSASLHVRPGNVAKGLKAFVTIMKGCDNFCSYCIVPYVRGREVSRRSTDIIEEIRELAREGVREITLLGQNVNSYNKHGGDLSFPQLLRAIDGIDGIDRIRFVTSHPKDLSGDLIKCFGTLPKLCEQIHLPFQSGSDKILRLMNRKYTIDEYRQKIAQLREQCPRIAITADCIVGFPQEEEKDFDKTMSLVRETEFDGIFSFVYSPRKFTSAASFEGSVTREIGLERLRHLQDVQKAITLKKNRALEGDTQEVMVEETSKGSAEDITGRTRTNKIVNFRGPGELIGELANVTILKGYANSLRGELSQ